MRGVLRVVRGRRGEGRLRERARFIMMRRGRTKRKRSMSGAHICVSQAHV